MLDSGRGRQHDVRLLDLYGPLLTPHQRRVLHLAWEEDWSYGEVAEQESVSRAAIFDLVRRTRRSLQEYERRLQLDRERRSQARMVETLRARLAALEREISRLTRRLNHV